MKENKNTNSQFNFAYSNKEERQKKWQFRLVMALMIAAIAMVSYMEHQDRVAMGIISEKGN